jgi:hypothetical protein
MIVVHLLLLAGTGCTVRVTAVYVVSNHGVAGLILLALLLFVSAFCGTVAAGRIGPVLPI